MDKNKDRAIEILNRLIELELAGAVRYTQCSLMVFGHARIPIMHWMRQQAAESLAHATEAGQEVTAMGGKISLGIAALSGKYHQSIDDILRDLLLLERAGIEHYRELLKVSEGWSVSLEEYARAKIRDEELHLAEIEKMLPGTR